MPCVHASVSTIKGLSKRGKARTGVLHKADFSSLKAAAASSDHSNASFYVNSVKGRAIVPNVLTKRL